MTNIDQSEVDKFDSLASRWWDPQGEMKALHDINPIRLNYINNKVEIGGLNVLDVGCGAGILSESLARTGANVTAIDCAENAIKIAKLHSQSNSLDIDYRVTPVENLLPEHAEQFDVITCMEMLEHVPDPASIINSCAGLLKPGGHLFLSTLNRNLKSYIHAIFGAEYLLRLVPKGTHDYGKFIKPSEVDTWLRENKIQTKNISGMGYNPISKKYKLTNDPKVNYLMYATKDSE